MILVVDNDLKNMTLHVFKEGRRSISQAVFAKGIEEISDDGSLKRFIRRATKGNKPEAIFFRLLFGGYRFSGPAALDPEFFRDFEGLTDLFPFYVPMTSRLLRRFRGLFEGTPMTAFFETSFFMKLPDEEKRYTLPFKYYDKDRIGKWGYNGIFHEANSALLPPGHSGISIVFDSQTTVCALRCGSPLSISLGRTPLEGVMSRTSCGDLDPGIVFYLMNVHDFSIYEIDEMLKRKSGFLGLTGYDIGLKDMIRLRGKDRKVDLAFEVYLAQIIKHIGDGIALMGGLDNIVFAGGNVDMCAPLIHDLLRKTAFLGVNPSCLPWNKAGDTVVVTSAESAIKGYINRRSLARIIFETGTNLKIKS